LVVVALLSLVACSDAAGPCVELRETVDILNSDLAPVKDHKYGRVAQYKADGYQCNDEALYNAFGTRTGWRYICTRCR
jgi:hypothetical protein